MTKESFLSTLKRDIDIYSGDIMMKSGNSFLTYQEFVTLCAKLNVAAEKYCGKYCQEIDIATEMAKAVIAPDLKTKKKHLKKGVSLASGVAGIGLIIAGIGAALGWGAGVITTVTAAIGGMNLVPIFGQIAAGAAITAIAAYFLFHEETHEEVTHKALEALKQGISKNIDEIWKKYGSNIESFNSLK